MSDSSEGMDRVRQYRAGRHDWTATVAFLERALAHGEVGVVELEAVTIDAGASESVRRGSTRRAATDRHGPLPRPASHHRRVAARTRP
jgi:hypothetical protein